MIKRWEKAGSRIAGDFRVFRIREDDAVSPTSGERHGFFVMEANDWVNVIPVTSDGKIVFIRQYRHGTEEVTLEVPGGIIDDEDASPAEAARREMIEETGYDSEEISEIGVVAPNPAIQNNRCYSFVALDASPQGRQALDHGEDIHVVLIDPADVPELIARGEITHALVVAAFYFFHRFVERPSAASSGQGGGMVSKRSSS